MIPVALPSLSFVLLLLASALGALALLGWSAALAFSGRARRAFGRRRLACGGLYAVLLVLAGYFAYFQGLVAYVQYEIEQEWRTRHYTLPEAARVGGIDMPAGTRLSLEVAHSPDTYNRAEFPHPVSAHGLQALRIERYIGLDHEPDTYKLTEAYPLTMRVTGPGTQTIQGWRCDAASPMHFSTRRDGRIAAFEECMLAEGNRADGMEVPPGARLLAHEGTVYTDGHVDPDRWQVWLEPDMAVRIGGVWLAGAIIRLDAERRYHAFERAELACPLAFGPMHYPAGTEVRSAGRGWRERHPGAWIFSPVAGAPARYAGHPEVADGHAVVQGRGGEVLAVVPNNEAGVLRFAAIAVGGDDAAAPRRAACPPR
ncbi:hypothetical protein L489_4027 [Bordetella bronchiseptica 00-P-2730]|nr:hypothetical protein L489_4027 [Bordetella bronchiseptica 00-P-2730]